MHCSTVYDVERELLVIQLWWHSGKETERKRHTCMSIVPRIYEIQKLDTMPKLMLEGSLTSLLLRAEYCFPVARPYALLLRNSTSLIGFDKAGKTYEASFSADARLPVLGVNASREVRKFNAAVCRYFVISVQPLAIICKCTRSFVRDS